MPLDTHNQTDSASVATQADSPTSTRDESTPSVHWLLHSQGGLGKSVIASWLAQYLAEKGEVTCLDADPMQKSLSRFSALSPMPVKLLNEDEIDVESMDACIERIITGDENFVIDCGASGFVALASYLMRDSLIELIASTGKQVYVHTVVVGGDRQDHTVATAKDIALQMPPAVKIVLWLNPKFGPILHEDAIKSYFEDHGASVIRIPGTHPLGDGANIDTILKTGKTFAEAANDFNMIAKLRVGRFWEALCNQMASRL